MPTSSRRKFLAPVLATLAAAMVGLSMPGTASAQVSRLDKGRLIEGLADRNMSELLDHLIDVDPPKNDIERAQLRIQQSLLRYRDPNVPQAEQVKSFKTALQTRRKLVKNNPDNRMRPIWLAELAELLLVQRVQGVGSQADLFYEFGIPTEKQRAIFGKSAVEALEALNQADQEIFDLRGRLGRDAQFRRQLKQGNLLRRIEQYEKARIPFFAAHAAYYLALLPDDDPYYQRIANAQGNPEILGQAESIDQERTRLLNEAYGQVKPLVDDNADQYGIRKAAMSLAGRIQIARGKIDQGIAQLLEPVRNDPNLTQATFHLAAGLGIGHGLTLQEKFGPAQKQIKLLKDDPLVTQQGAALLRLLVTDALHKSLLAEVNQAPPNQQKQMRRVAYKPYEQFLSRLPSEARRSVLRNYVFNRWASQIPDNANPEDYPPFERMATGEIARLRAQSLLYNDQGQVTNKQKQRQDAAAMAERGVVFNETLKSRNLSPYVRARGMFNLAASLYVRETAGSGQQVSTMIRVVKLMTSVAEQMPDQPIAQQAMQNAIAFGRRLHQLDNKPQGVDETYRHAANVLFDQYGGSQIARQERLYFAYNVLQENGEYEKAVAMYNKVPRSSADYFGAQREKIYSLQKIYQQAQGASAKQLARQNARDAAQQLLEEAKQASDQSANSPAKTAAGSARLVLADIAMINKRTDKAVDLLNNFEQDYQANAGLVQRGLEKRIMALVDGNRLEQAANQAKAMMNRFPQFGASVVSQILNNFDRRIDDLLTRAQKENVSTKKQKLKDQASKLADTAVTLASALFNWAKGKGMTGENLLPYQLILSKSLRLTGQPQNVARAKKIMMPLKDQYQQQGQVIREAADALYASGKSFDLNQKNPKNLSKQQKQNRQDLVQAKRLYNRLIGATRKSGGNTFWHSWVRTLTIMGKLNQDTDSIPNRVRQLQTAKDEDLGGPQFKPELERLRDKYN